MNLSPRDPGAVVLYGRLIGMMVDYSITLKEALHWDIDGFPPYWGSAKLSEAERFDYYLHCNYVNISDRRFLVEIAVSENVDFHLKKAPPTT